MTHVTCRLTAKNRDQLRNPCSVIEYGLPLPLREADTIFAQDEQNTCLRRAVEQLRCIQDRSNSGRRGRDGGKKERDIDIHPS